MNLFAPADIDDIIASLGQSVTINGHAAMAVVDSHSLDALHAQALGVDTVLTIASDLITSLAIVGGGNGSTVDIGQSTYVVRKVADEGNGFATLELERQ